MHLTVQARFGGEELVLLDNQDQASYPTLSVRKTLVGLLQYTIAKQKYEPNNSSNSAPFNFWNDTVAPWHELAHDEDHACGCQEEAGVNRTAEGNAGDEPRRRRAIQQEVAEAEQARASRGKRCQPLDEPGTE